MVVTGTGLAAVPGRAVLYFGDPRTAMVAATACAAGLLTTLPTRLAQPAAHTVDAMAVSANYSQSNASAASRADAVSPSRGGDTLELGNSKSRS